MGDYFGTSGASWGTMGAAGWTGGGVESDLQRLCGDLGTPFCFIISYDMLLFRIVESKSRRFGLPEPGFRMEDIAKNNSSRNLFLRMTGRLLFFVGGFGSSFSGFCCPGDRLGN